jgi:nucleolar protein 9
MRAINPDTPSPNCIVPRMFFLESLAGTGKFSQEWKPPFGSRLSVLGSAMLQIIFSYPQECCQQFCASMAALDTSDVLHIVRDPGGSRAIEAFLSSGAVPVKHKHRLIAKLKGHFAELGVEPICSYVVEKSFSVGDMKLKEMIAAELTLAESELSKTRNGPFLLKRCNIPSYAKGADQWRKQESSKQGTRELFAEIFQATHEVPFDTKALRAQPTKVEGKKRKISSSTRSSEPTGSKVSTLNLDDTMAQLGFDLSKFQKSNKKTKVAKMSGNRDLTFGTEHGGLPTFTILEDQRTKSDDIDMLFMRKSKVQKKRG